MSAENTEFDDGPAPDPFEAELVAYLDGELDPAAARRVAARLANDPAARARAAELKKSFDLLDYLPKPEPTPNFTTRTLEKLPAIKSASAPGGAASGSGARTPASAPKANGARSAPASAVSTSMPVALELEAAPPPRRTGGWLKVASVCAAAAVFGVLGYFATAAVRPVLFPPSAARDKEHEDVKTDLDPRIIELLPLYAVADDIGFVQDLAKPELFGEEPAVVYDQNLKVPNVDLSDKPTGKPFEALVKAYRGLPPVRQAEISKLDQELHAKEPKERDRLMRLMEVYAAWLDRLPEPERRGVLGAATPNLRLAVIRDLREQQWLDALPPPLRKKVETLTNPKEKAELIAHLKDDEAGRKDRWAFMRLHADAFAANRSPWPFDTEAGRKEVIEFARATLKPDDPKKCRLAPDELAEYRRTQLLAERDGAWAWFGLTVYELSRLHPYLPEPAEPKALYTDILDVPEPVRQLVKKGGNFRLRAVAGKWPEFPLELHRELTGPKNPFVPALGPARLSDFKEPVRLFAEKELFRRMTAEERSALHRLEGKWPEYPRELVRYATRYDLSVPGVTLPGAPKKWDATYGARPNPRAAN